MVPTQTRVSPAMGSTVTLPMPPSTGESFTASAMNDWQTARPAGVCVPWQQKLSEIAQIEQEPLLLDFDESPMLALDNGINIQEAQLVWQDENKLLLKVTWQADQKPAEDYSVAVHVLSQNPPTGPQDLVLQADSIHPVYGWYPTTLWQEGEVVMEHYELVIPEGTNPAFVRLGMYRQLSDGTFENTEWLVLDIPER